MILLFAGSSLLALGMALITDSARREFAYLRTARQFLHAEMQIEDRNDQALTGILQRLREVLSSIELGRALGLGIAVLGALAMAESQPVAEWTSSIAQRVGTWLPLLLAAMVFLLSMALEQLGRSAGAALNGSNGRRWIEDAKREVPMPYVWSRFVRETKWQLLSVFWSSLRESPTQGVLYEKDGKLRLAMDGAEVKELVAEVRSTETSGRASQVEEQMLRAIGRLDRTFVRAAMRPLNKVIALSLREATPQLILSLARRTGLTRLPVYEDNIANLLGYVNIYEFLDVEKPPRDVRGVVQKALYVPELARITDVLELFRSQKAQVAIVFDEFGASSGWITREDIIEEIVGDIEDEHDRLLDTQTYTVEGREVVEATIDLDRLAEEKGLRIEKASFDTLAGFIYWRLSGIPEKGDEIEEQGWRLVIEEMEGHRIRFVRIVPPPPVPDDES